MAAPLASMDKDSLDMSEASFQRETSDTAIATLPLCKQESKDKRVHFEFGDDASFDASHRGISIDTTDSGESSRFSLVTPGSSFEEATEYDDESDSDSSSSDSNVINVSLASRSCEISDSTSSGSYDGDIECDSYGMRQPSTDNPELDSNLDAWRQIEELLRNTMDSDDYSNTELTHPTGQEGPAASGVALAVSPAREHLAHLKRLTKQHALTAYQYSRSLSTDDEQNQDNAKFKFLKFRDNSQEGGRMVSFHMNNDSVEKGDMRTNTDSFVETNNACRNNLPKDVDSIVALKFEAKDGTVTGAGLTPQSNTQSVPQTFPPTGENVTRLGIEDAMDDDIIVHSDDMETNHGTLPVRMKHRMSDIREEDFQREGDHATDGNGDDKNDAATNNIPEATDHRADDQGSSRADSSRTVSGMANLQEQLHDFWNTRIKKIRKSRVVFAAVIKYVLFSFNFFFWIIGLVAVVLGYSLLVDKNKVVRDALDFFFDPAIILCVSGFVISVVAFFGCLGALRENIVLLKIFHIILTLVLIAELVMGILIFLFYFITGVREGLGLSPEEWGFRQAMIKYHDDKGLKQWIDMIQQEMKCCGFSNNDFGYRDWELNVYFNCTFNNPSTERCGVPASCCILEKGNYINLMCGYDIGDKDHFELTELIYTQGCVKGFGEWIERNSLVIGLCCLGIMIPQIVGIISTRIFIKLTVQRQKQYKLNKSRHELSWTTIVSDTRDETGDSKEDVTQV